MTDGCRGVHCTLQALNPKSLVPFTAGYTTSIGWLEAEHRAYTAHIEEKVFDIAHSDNASSKEYDVLIKSFAFGSCR